MATRTKTASKTTASIEELIDAEFERIDHEMFEEDRKLLEETGRVFPAMDDVLEEDITAWAVNSAGHRYNPHPTVYFRRFYVNDEGQRIACFSFVHPKHGVRNAVRTAIIDYDLTYAPLIGATMKVTMRQEPDQWYILDPKSTSKPKAERVTYVFNDAENEQFQKLIASR